MSRSTIACHIFEASTHTWMFQVCVKMLRSYAADFDILTSQPQFAISSLHLSLLCLSLSSSSVTIILLKH